MTHIDRLRSIHQKLAPDTTISLPVARDHGFYAGILYPYLWRKQREQTGYSDRYNVRMGIRWIAKLTAAEVVEEVPAFPNTQTVLRAAETLLAAGLILTETTGAFLEPDHRTNRRRDIATWWHVSRDHVAAKVPTEYLDTKQHYLISALESTVYGVAQALILAHWRRSELVLDEDDHLFKKLSVVELEKVLPMDERTIRRHLKKLVERELLIQHEKQPKLYRLGRWMSGSRSHTEGSSTAAHNSQEMGDNHQEEAA